MGIVRRFHGGATLNEDRNVTERLKYLFDKEIEFNRRQKESIAAKAASMVRNGETIAFDIGTTAPFIARHLSPEIRITAICHTFACLKELYEKKHIEILLSGGHLDRETNVFYGQNDTSYLWQTRSDRVFISPGGVDKKLGMTCFSIADAEIKRMLMKSSREVIMVADSTKLGKIWPAHFAEFSDFSKLISDSGLSQEYRDYFENLGIEVILVDAP